MATTPAVKNERARRLFHYLERAVTVNTVIYGRCTGALGNRHSRNTEIPEGEVAPASVCQAGVLATGFIGDLETVHRGFKATDSELSSNFTSSKIGSIGEKDSRQNLSRPAPINTNSERLTNDSTSSPLPERARDHSSSGYRTVETSSALDLDVEQRAGPQDFGWRRIGHLDVEVRRTPLIHRCRGFGNHGRQCGRRRGRRSA